MDTNKNHDYFYTDNAEIFSFYIIPKELIKKEEFTELSIASKMLYSLLLDRMNLSLKNGYYDKEKRVYIIYQIKDICNDTNLTKKTVIKYLKELENFGLIEREKRCKNRPNLIYVKNFLRCKEYTSRSVNFTPHGCKLYTSPSLLVTLNSNTKDKSINRYIDKPRVGPSNFDCNYELEEFTENYHPLTLKLIKANYISQYDKNCFRFNWFFESFKQRTDLHPSPLVSYFIDHIQKPEFDSSSIQNKYSYFTSSIIKNIHKLIKTFYPSEEDEKKYKTDEEFFQKMIDALEGL